MRIAVSLPSGVHLVAPALPAFRARYPDVTIDVRVNDEIVDIVDQRINVAVRIGDLADSRLLSRRLAPYQLCAFAAPGYLATRGIPIHLSELGDTKR